jgi:MFS family permease
MPRTAACANLLITLLVALLLKPSSSWVLSSPRSKATVPWHSTVTARHVVSRRQKLPTIMLGGGEAVSLPKELMPISMGVFSQMLGEGIAMSSLPLHLTRLGAEPLLVGVGISCFSVTQMTFAPLMVQLSSKIGRSLVLRICLCGAAASSLLIALSGRIYGVIAGRALAGVFAACVPVAQSAVTDILPKNQTSLGLSRVSAASQLGIVVGPGMSALLQTAFLAVGLPSEHCLPAVFVLAAAFALSVLAQMAYLDRRCRGARSEGCALIRDEEPAKAKEEGPNGPSDAGGTSMVLQREGRELASLRWTQPMLRFITIVIGWTAVLSNSIYGLFAPRFMGFRQPQLSATYSAAAALAIAAQVVFPRLVAAVGEHRVCALGILAAGTGIGGQALLRVQPLHTLLYLTNRVGAAVADTATAVLVAGSSVDREARSRNLALLTSTRAAARIVSPILSSKMFDLSCQRSVAPGALPFVTAASFALATAPLPLALRRAQRQCQQQDHCKH